jgi:hypothetical protein
MQRLFNMFPPGLPGLALLALRTSVALALLNHSRELSVWLERASVDGWQAIRLAMTIR